MCIVEPLLSHVPGGVGVAVFRPNFFLADGAPQLRNRSTQKYLQSRSWFAFCNPIFCICSLQSQLYFSVFAIPFICGLTLRCHFGSTLWNLKLCFNLCNPICGLLFAIPSGDYSLPSHLCSTSLLATYLLRSWCDFSSACAKYTFFAGRVLLLSSSPVRKNGWRTLCTIRRWLPVRP